MAAGQEPSQEWPEAIIFPSDVSILHQGEQHLLVRAGLQHLVSLSHSLLECPVADAGQVITVDNELHGGFVIGARNLAAIVHISPSKGPS
jgi:hypothetical protein